ncbi:unnamed protein product [Penicillium pancosmium]
MPLIQLHPHPFTILPSHPSLPPGPPRPEAKHVASTALQEALELLNSDLPTWDKDPKTRRSPPAYADIRLSRKWRKYEQMPDPSSSSSSSSSSPSPSTLKRKPEFWVCRQSEHPDAAVAGSASWTEFEDGLRSEHAEHEMEYTPSVTGVERLLQWTEQEIGELDMNGVTFEDVDVEALISPRSFISFTISATYDAHSNEPSHPSKGFITVQIPLHPDPTTTPTAIHEKIKSAVPKRTIFANYASVERVAKKNGPLESSSSQQQQQVYPPLIQWTMATTSDAGGLIPQWVQRNWTLGGVPRAIVADVGLFIDWSTKRRALA